MITELMAMLPHLTQLAVESAEAVAETVSGGGFLPTPPGGTSTEIAQKGVEFFGTWIGRIGGIVAFIGAIKFALSIRSDDGKEQIQALLTLVSGFMIQAAVGDLSIFNIPAKYSVAASNAEFKSILNFVGGWMKRVGAVASFIGAAMFGLSIKDHNAGQKVLAMKTFAAGAIVISVAAMISQFVK